MTEPRNILISRRDFMQDPSVILSGGFWETNLPLSNILDPRPQFVAQAVTNKDWAATAFTVDLGYQRTVGLFFFANLRTSSLGLMSLQAGTEDSDNYDTGVIPSWPQDSVAGEFTPWGEWTLNGVYSGEEYANLGLTRFFVPPEPIACRYITVVFRDSCAIVPLQIGCFGACEVWESGNNYIPGPQITISDNSEVLKAPFGSMYITQRGIYRRFNYGFPAQDSSDVLARSLGLILIKGKSVPLVAVSFPDDTENLEKMSVYGLVSTDNVLSNPYTGIYAQPVQIDQII